MTFIYPIIMASIFFVYFDATKNKIGKIPDQKGFTNMSAGMWAFGTLMLWIIIFPVYLISRGKLIEKAKEYPQVVSGAARGIKLGILGILFLLSIAGSFIDSSLLNQEVHAQDIPTEISGVWRGSEGTMITIDLVSPNKSLTANTEMAPVTINDIDTANLIVSLNATIDDEKVTWALQQNYKDNGTFYLTITLHDGRRDELSFVRNL